MKNNIRKTLSIASFCSLFLIFVSCNKFEELQMSPNSPSKGSPNLVLPYLIQSVFNNGNPTGWSAAAQQLFYTERRESTQYWGWNSDGFGWYDDMRQTMKMEQEAINSNGQAYIPIARFIRQLAFYEQTRRVGDIPYTDALRGELGEFTPAYSTQKDVFMGILTELEQINDDIALHESTAISGDLLYNGDLRKWRKLVNSYRLKILMDLSLKVNDDDLKVKERFNIVFSNSEKYPIFESNDDMPQFKFFDQESNRYPTYNQITTRIQQKLTTTMVDFLKEKEDPRLFSFAEPAWPAESTNWTEDQRSVFRKGFENYEGLDPALIHGDGSKMTVSNLNWRFYEDPTGENYVKFSFAELNFIIAEAALRGWITADPLDFFNKGIGSSMAFYGINSSDYFNDHPSALPINVNEAIELVNMQKYIAFFMNSSWEAWFNQRRMKSHQLGLNGEGVPAFKVGDSHYVTEAPLRWEYPQSEIFNNEINVNEAINRQFGGQNSITGIMWMIKE